MVKIFLILTLFYYIYDLYLQQILKQDQIMNKRVYLFSFLAMSLFTFCDNNDDSNSDNQAGTNIEINTDLTSLNSRLDYTDSGVISITNASASKSAKSEAAASALPLVQIAEINPPKDSKGRTLQANHVAVNGNYAYVAYTMIGETYSGAIDVIDVTDPYKPKLLNSALIADTDITALTYSNGNLIIAGAADLDKNPALTSPAILINMQLSSGLLTDKYTITALDSRVTTDVAANTSSYFAVTGDAGSLFKINSSTKAIAGKAALEDLRTIAVSGDKIVTLSGKKGVNVYSESTLALQKTFTTSTDVSGAKRTVDFDGTRLLVSEGYNGLGVYDINSGSKLQSLLLATAGEDNVTNAVSVNDGYAFVANGALGLNVYKTGTQLSLLGTVGIAGSSNYVKSSGDYIYVASGKGGLKIIKMEKPNAAFASCSSYGIYNQGQNLILNSNEVKSYSGATAISSVIVNSGATLTHCGAISIQNGLTLNSGGTFNMRGTLSQGKYLLGTELIINSNALLQIEGSVVIWGDLRLNSGAKINFVGNDSSITIYGKVTKNSNVTITGTFKDTENKLK